MKTVRGTSSTNAISHFGTLVWNQVLTATHLNAGLLWLLWKNMKALRKNKNQKPQGDVCCVLFSKQATCSISGRLPTSYSSSGAQALSQWQVNSSAASPLSATALFPADADLSAVPWQSWKSGQVEKEKKDCLYVCGRENVAKGWFGVSLFTDPGDVWRQR